MKRKSYSYGRMKAIVIDEDGKNINSIREMIQDYFPDEMQLVAIFKNPIEALDALGELSIDMIFIEVDHPEMNGFDFISALPENPKLKVVFMSENERHAMKAFKYEVFDYLSKPLVLQDFTSCIKRFEKYRSMPNIMVEDFMRNDLLIINRQDKAVFVGVKEIIRLEANGSYTDIFLENGLKFNSTKNIMYYEERLSKQRFYKVHRSHLINLAKVKELIKYDGDGIIIMQDNSKIEISRTKKNEFLRALTR